MRKDGREVKWGDFLRQDSRDCGTLTNPTNGAVSTTGTLQTSVATYTCSAGFRLTGVSTRTCVLGSGWSDVAPTCVSGKVGDSCATVTNLCENLINAPCTGGTCTCLTGYTQSTDSECVDPNDCQSAPCQNGGACTDGLATFTCSCAAGYTGATCATNIYECSSNPCKNMASCNDGVNGYTCSCVAGYTGIHCETIRMAYDQECSVTAECGTTGATCRNDGLGSFRCLCTQSGEIYVPSSETCLKECPVLTAPEYGAVDKNSTTTPIGGVATYTCNPNLVINGVDKPSCTANGWNSTKPTCECPVLTSPEYGAVDKVLTTTPIGGVATYTCNPNLVINGVDKPSCTANGWNSTKPTCECPELTAPEYGAVDKNSTTTPIGGVATYTCNPNLVINGVDKPSCTANGWNSTKPTCECPVLTAPVYGAVDKNSTTTPIGGVETYTCNPNLVINGVVKYYLTSTADLQGTPVPLSQLWVTQQRSDATLGWIVWETKH
ncbi:fibropellin-1-like [Dreissena polymorpha]|uniref:fibropellin-1-like n=1 Tax=Dreissena polymorpha TaxID=45954 RepID=UPI002264D71E|nr:fibropellin-1-like [Dreissena polymorpha]